MQRGGKSLPHGRVLWAKPKKQASTRRAELSLKACLHRQATTELVSIEKNKEITCRLSAHDYLYKCPPMWKCLNDQILHHMQAVRAHRSNGKEAMFNCFALIFSLPFITEYGYSCHVVFGQYVKLLQSLLYQAKFWPRYNKGKHSIVDIQTGFVVFPCFYLNSCCT